MKECGKDKKSEIGEKKLGALNFEAELLYSFKVYFTASELLVHRALLAVNWLITLCWLYSFLLLHHINIAQLIFPDFSCKYLL